MAHRRTVSFEQGGASAAGSALVYRGRAQAAFPCATCTSWSTSSSRRRGPPDPVRVNFRRGSSRSLCEDPGLHALVKEVFEEMSCKNARCGPLNMTLAAEACRRRGTWPSRPSASGSSGSSSHWPRTPSRPARHPAGARPRCAGLRMVAFADKYETWKKWVAKGGTR